MSNGPNRYLRMSLEVIQLRKKKTPMNITVSQKEESISPDRIEHQQILN